MKPKSSSEFQKKVLKKLKEIPHGRVTSYKEIARALGNEKAVRAVGNALNKNLHPNVYPCYKVVKEDKSLGGYSRGIKKKKELLRKEGIKIKNNKIDAEIYRFR